TIRVKNSRTLNIKETDQGLQVTGALSGTARITVGEKDYDFIIRERRELEFLAKVKEIISGFRGLYVETVGGEIYIRGQLHRLSDWERISDLARITRGKYIFAARPDPDILSEAESFIQSALSSENLPQLQIEFSPAAKIFAPLE